MQGNDKKRIQDKIDALQAEMDDLEKKKTVGDLENWEEFIEQGEGFQYKKVVRIDFHGWESREIKNEIKLILKRGDVCLCIDEDSRDITIIPNKNKVRS